MCYYFYMEHTHKNNSNKFTERLKELRQEKSLSQKQIAEKLGIPVSTYANWEQGRREPSVNDIFKILTVLNINANELFN